MEELELMEGRKMTLARCLIERTPCGVSEYNLGSVNHEIVGLSDHS
jgi:hypothetical protein